MRTISTYSGRLRWTQPHLFRREYELRSDTDLLATMALQGFSGRSASVESEDGAWSFKRIGWCGMRATARASGQETNLAEFEKDFWTTSGEVTFPSGSKFTVAMNFWMTRFEIGTKAQGPLVRFARQGFCRRSADVEILDRSAPEVPMLVLFGWYLLLMLHQDASAVIVS